jgi:hypothetical protein
MATKRISVLDDFTFDYKFDLDDNTSIAELKTNLAQTFKMYARTYSFILER